LMGAEAEAEVDEAEAEPDMLAETAEEMREGTDALTETAEEPGVGVDALTDAAEESGGDADADASPDGVVGALLDWRSSSICGPPHFSYWGLPAQGVLQFCEGTSVCDAPFAKLLPQ